MPASDNSTQRTQALALLKRRGMTRLAEFSEAGITATTVGRMERAGEVVRLARGLYQLPDAALDAQQSLAEAARLVPKGVICLASALAFHGLTDQMPPKVWIAIEQTFSAISEAKSLAIGASFAMSRPCERAQAAS